MKGIIEFDLPAEQDEMNLALTAQLAKIALHDFIDESLRKRIKYSTELTEDQLVLLNSARTELFEFYKDRNLEAWLE